MPETPLEPMYDIFVSYRSIDIHIVRPIAEQLMAAGLKVWFAECEILPDNWKRFDEAITYGLTHCSFGVCITNDEYAGSKACQKELKGLLERLGPERIVDLGCPPQPLIEKEFPEIKKAHRFEYRNLVQALRDIQSAIGCDTQFSLVPPEVPENRHRFSSHGLRYSADFGGWEVREHWFGFLGGGDRRIATYRRSWNGNTIYGHLIAGPMDIMRNHLNMDENKDNRAYYEAVVHFAEGFYRTRLRQTPVGLHLSFVPGTLSQAALTTQVMTGVTSRLYSIVIPSYLKGCDIELAFFFFYNGQINGFWRRACLLDRLIHSLQVENQSTEMVHGYRPGRYKIIKTVDRLLSFGQADSFLLGGWLSSQLGKAVLKGDLNIVKELLTEGVNLNKATVLGSGPRGQKFRGTPLMVAAAEGLKQIVVELLAHGAQVNFTDGRGWTALFYATENGYKEICELLLDSGADPNIQSAQLGTALMIAAIKGHADIAQLLLERGANASFRDAVGKSALDFAYKHNRSGIISVLEGK